MNIFYEPDILAGGHVLGREESDHAARVLRLRKGDPVVVVSGKGDWCEAVLTLVQPRHCEFMIKKAVPEFEKRNYHLHLAVAPTKNADRMEWLLEKATEMGIDCFTPLLCRYSERKVLNTGRLKKITVAAMKQSLKAYLPEVYEMTPFDDFIRQPVKGNGFIAHCHSRHLPHMAKRLLVSGDATVLIGPEGDFSEEEVRLALQYGYQEISLGNARLRTETAALAACHTVALINTVMENPGRPV
jgi:16S rRNA (uracil1498-N3)-methyltransferase